ncbi:hypothetical protein D3C76_90950 [compost metagenome]
MGQHFIAIIFKKGDSRSLLRLLLFFFCCIPIVRQYRMNALSILFHKEGIHRV